MGTSAKYGGPSASSALIPSFLEVSVPTAAPPPEEKEEESEEQQKPNPEGKKNPEAPAQ